MFEAKRVAVVIPAYCEERLIGRTLTTLPSFVDAVYVVDDCSPDGTSHAARAVGDTRVRVLRHASNRGVGAAIVSGYRAALAEQADVVAVMGGDAQMDPADLAAVVAPVAAGAADYAKGNRFRSRERHRMPWPRRVAGKVLSWATRMASGLDVDDCQCGFTAIGKRALLVLPLDELWPRFGYPNDLLLLLAAHELRVEEVTVRPVYADERSGVKPWHALLILGLVVRRWWRSSRPLLASTWAPFWLGCGGFSEFLRGHLRERSAEKVSRLSHVNTQLAPAPPVFLVARGLPDDRDLASQDRPTRD